MKLEKSNVSGPGPDIYRNREKVSSNTILESEKNSSFISIRVSKSELEKLVLVSTRCREIGLNVGVSTVVKKVYEAGLTLLCLDNAYANPLSLFLEDGGAS